MFSSGPGGRVRHSKAITFCLSSVPYTFFKLQKPVVSTLSKLLIRLIFYLDDMMTMVNGRKQSRSKETFSYSYATLDLQLT